MAILELVVNQVYRGQQVINRFNYVSSGTPAAVSLSFALMKAAGFIDLTGTPGVFPVGSLGRNLQACTGTTLVFKSIYARDLYSNTDFYERPFAVTVAGVRTSTPMSPLLALGFVGSRVRTDIKRASKRIAGQCEGDWGDGGGIEAGFGGAAADLATVMSEVLEYDDEGNTITFSPCVLGLEEYTTPSGKRAYRRYATANAQLSHLAVGFVYSPVTELRSQTSRQYGRGA